MTISLGKNIGFVLTNDENIMVLEPTIDLLKKEVIEHIGESDEKLVLYDFLQILAEKVKITVNATPPNSIIKLYIDE